jgi:hypothetical protein
MDDRDKLSATAKPPSPKWVRWVWIGVAIIVVLALLAYGVVMVIAMGLLASA